MKFLIRRIGFYAVALWTAITINFLLPRAMPGDPAAMLFMSMRGRMSAESFKLLKKVYGFEGNLWDQYVIYLKKVLVLDFGISTISFPQPVMVNLKYAMIWTCYLAGMALVIAALIGITMGMFAAWNRGKTYDTVFTPVNVILSAFNPAVVALLLFYFFALELDWFPIGRAHGLDIDPGLNWDYIKNVIYHSILPIASVLVYTIGSWHLAMRNNMINLLNEDFVTMARAKGLSNNRVMIKYAARNAILPIITQLAMSVGFVFGGVLFTEVVFNYPGLGKFTLTAINLRDYNFIQGQMLFLTVAVLIANLISDVLNVVLDPRLRHTGVK